MMRAVLGEDPRTPAKWEDLWRGHVRMVGEEALLHVLSFRTPTADLRARLDSHGVEQIRAALDRGSGAVLLCCHTGHFLGQLILAGSLAPEVLAFGNPLPSSRTEHTFTRFFSRIGVDRRLVGRGQSTLVTDVLRRNGVVVTFCDVTTVPRNNAWVPFGHTETLVNLGPVLLGLRNEAPLFVLTSRALPGGRTAVWVHPPLRRVGTNHQLEDAYTAACQAMAIVSDEVLKNPEQWWQWDTECYRTPDGQAFGHPGPYKIEELKEGCYEPPATGEKDRVPTGVI